MKNVKINSPFQKKVAISPFLSMNKKAVGEDGGYRYAEYFKNFDLSSGELKVTDGFKASNITSSVVPLKFYFYKRNDYLNGNDDRLLCYAQDGKIYDAPLSGGAFTLISGLNYPEAPVGVCYNYNGDDVIIFSSENGDMKIYNGSTVTAIADAPNVTSMCLHYERLFLTSAGNDNSLWFSDDFDPTNWNVSLSEAGFIDFSDERGDMIKVVSFADYLYVFRTYGITRITAYAEQSEFSATNLYVSSGKIYPNSITECGNCILFLASDGLYRFDGLSTQKISDRFDEYIDYSFTGVKGAYFDGNAYFVMKMFLDGVSEKCLLKVDPSTGNFCPITCLNVKDICLVNSEAEYGLYIATENDTSVSKLTHDGMAFGQPITAVWQSKASDFNINTDRKLLKKVTLYSDKDVELTVIADGKERLYTAVGKVKRSDIKTNITGDKFSVRIVSKKGDARISKCVLDFIYYNE